MRNSHKWSGWPGAYCLRCGAEDPLENAIGMGWYDPFEDKWDTPEHEEEVRRANECSVVEDAPKD